MVEQNAIEDWLIYLLIGLLTTKRDDILMEIELMSLTNTTQ